MKVHEKLSRNVGKHWENRTDAENANELKTKRGKANGLNTQEGNQGQVEVIGAIRKADKDRKCTAK